MKPKIQEIIIVEGRDDISAVKAAVDAEIIQVNGFAIRKKGNIDLYAPGAGENDIEYMICSMLWNSKSLRSAFRRDEIIGLIEDPDVQNVVAALLGGEEVGETVLCQDDGAGKLVVVELDNLADEVLYLGCFVGQRGAPRLELDEFALYGLELVIAIKCYGPGGEVLTVVVEREGNAAISCSGSATKHVARTISANGVVFGTLASFFLVSQTGSLII